MALKDTFAGKSRYLIAGDLDKFTLGGQTHLKEGGVFAIAFNKQGTQFDILFNIKAVQVRKAAEMVEADFEGNMMPGRHMLIIDPKDVNDDTLVTVVDLDTENPRYTHAYSARMTYPI